MSTSNNQYGQEVRPVWRDGAAELERKLGKLSVLRLAAEGRITNDTRTITAASFEDRGVTQIADFDGLSSVRRLNLSRNAIKRLAGLSAVPALSLLNCSHNALEGDTALEELRYTPLLRTLNIGENPGIRKLRTHVAKQLGQNLQALIANNIGLSSVGDLKLHSMPSLNTLVLSHNSLSQWDGEIDLPMLEKLSLSSNSLKHVPDLRSSPISELRLNNNELTSSSISESLFLSNPSSKRFLKTLDLSNNRIENWATVSLLAQNLIVLTNLGLKGNHLKTPPKELSEIALREDVGQSAAAEESDRVYRHGVLAAFQTHVGKEQKPFVRLLVLDSRRVKVKWSHHEGRPLDGAKSPPVVSKPLALSTEEDEVKDKKREAKTKEKKRKLEEIVNDEPTPLPSKQEKKSLIAATAPPVAAVTAASDSGVIMAQTFKTVRGFGLVALEKSTLALDKW